MRDGRGCPPTTPSVTPSSPLASAAEWESRSTEAGPLAKPGQRREGGGRRMGGAVKRVNRMMVVYGFGLRGARLRV